jgi:hypothetical protein
MFRIADSLQIPFFVSLVVMIPAIIIILNIYTVFYNYRSKLELEVIPEGKFEDRRASLATDMEQLKHRNFNKIDEFYVKTIPDVVVYAFKHSEEPIFLYLYHLGPKKSFDVVTAFTDGSGLTTNNSADSGVVPINPKNFMQIFQGASLETVLDNHRKAVDYLKGKGKEVADLSTEAMRKKFLNAFFEAGEMVKKHPIWPIMLIVWVYIKPGLKKHAMSIEDQYHSWKRDVR